MRSSDWSSDVCSSDLFIDGFREAGVFGGQPIVDRKTGIAVAREAAAVIGHRAVLRAILGKVLLALVAAMEGTAERHDDRGAVRERLAAADGAIDVDEQAALARPILRGISRGAAIDEVESGRATGRKPGNTT